MGAETNLVAVATDGSAGATLAVEWAASFARSAGAELLAIQVIRPASKPESVALDGGAGNGAPVAGSESAAPAPDEVAQARAARGARAVPARRRDPRPRRGRVGGGRRRGDPRRGRRGRCRRRRRRQLRHARSQAVPARQRRQSRHPPRRLHGGGRQHDHGRAGVRVDPGLGSAAGPGARDQPRPRPGRDPPALRAAAAPRGGPGRAAAAAGGVRAVWDRPSASSARSSPPVPT